MGEGEWEGEEEEEVEKKKESIRHPKNPLFDQEESNNLIRASDLGRVDLKFFENYMMKPEKNKIRYKQQWFVGLFDSTCTSPECLDAALNFEQLFLIWLGETMNKGGLDYNEEESWINSEDNMSVESLKIAQIDCHEYMEDICARILPQEEKAVQLPKYYVLDGESAYEWTAFLDYFKIQPYVDDFVFREDTKAKVHGLRAKEEARMFGADKVVDEKEF